MAAKPEKSTIRAALKQELGDEIHVEMAASIREALASSKTEWVECQHCHKKTPFAIPNMFERAKAAQLVLEQLEGKVGTHREVPAAAKKAVGELSELSDDDLLALLNADEPNEPEPDDEMESDDLAD